MIAEALKFLRCQFVQATSFCAVSTGDPRVKTYLGPEGKVVSLLIPPEVRSHRVETLTDFLAACEQWAANGVIWYTDTGATLVIDDDDRRDAIVFLFVRSDGWEALIENSGRALNQSAFSKFLKYDLRGYVSAAVVEAVKKLEAVYSSNSVREVGTGRERGTSEFSSELKANGEIPEVFDIRLPIYSNGGLNDSVTVQVVLDYTLPPQSVTFTVKPLPDQIANAEAAVMALLAERLKKSGLPVFNGTP